MSLLFTVLSLGMRLDGIAFEAKAKALDAGSVPLLFIEVLLVMKLLVMSKVQYQAVCNTLSFA